MSTQQVMSGARAQLIVNGRIVGLFTNCSWGVSYDAIPNYILGRFSPAEITYAGQEAISVQATGFRVVNNGAYVAAALPMLQDLLTVEDISLSIYDRLTGLNIMTVVGVRPVSYSTDVAARAVSSFSVNFLGLSSEDESGPQGEASGASTLLSGS
jgi:hypothetical protein